ncbi:MAG: 30S ribosome-binding factor RbfA [Oscillospiraceae bacterium]|jgi:ribosome-binding factor A|nr:30S ribosome-binding factor RbfA [Oscillospiraceae bacterium]
MINILRRRIVRTEKNLRYEISQIILKLKDPRINSEFINVPKVVLSSDASFLKVFVSSLGNLNHTASVCELLQNAVGFFRSKIGKCLKMRIVPEIKFTATDSSEYAIKLNEHLKEILRINRTSDDKQTEGNI